ncbi:MAG: class I SAM-dependent methyltransferase [Rhodospirillaceae bacterium]|jgi:ribosomal protein L11 methylase PrmA|nr:class I SAM-dependent methyltransferase [Rhodospirillaceae bacterium]MBT5050587.1 class I SAM-dependent methyltransferase [Rhodospirillaceae bacterium]MBT5457185.1 class I SAM-dependent methyltransferase [Rhodospirillaceae bacterium]
MEPARRDEASFRDPAGQVYRLEDRILRSVSAYGAPDYEFVRDSGLLSDLIASNRLISTDEVSADLLGTDGGNVRYVLEHSLIPFISYPYEWCFSALQSAALLQLDLLEESLGRGVTLSDASAYNVQFVGPEPLFIDPLSFRRYQEGDYWTAHQQFCEQFLNPLLLTALKDVPFNGWFRGHLEGIRSEDLNQFLSWRHLLNWRVLTHVTLPVRLQSRVRSTKDAQIERVKKRRLPRSSFLAMIGGLRKWIAGLKPPATGSNSWSGYEEDNSYDAAATAAKAGFTENFASTVEPAMLLDMGCNTGEYAKIALQAGAKEAVGFDNDPATVNTAFLRAKAQNLRFLPLVVDAADPSPGQGWLGQERKSLKDRANADALLAYAVVHHLAIGRNIPLPEIIAWLISLAPQGVIEFVEKEDPMIGRMLQLRDDIFTDYSRDAFLAAIGDHAEIVDTCEVIKGRRLLVWYRRPR